LPRAPRHPPQPRRPDLPDQLLVALRLPPPHIGPPVGLDHRAERRRHHHHDQPRRPSLAQPRPTRGRVSPAGLLWPSLRAHTGLAVVAASEVATRETAEVAAPMIAQVAAAAMIAAEVAAAVMTAAVMTAAHGVFAMVTAVEGPPRGGPFL